jgi:hypothetical protein
MINEIKEELMAGQAPDAAGYAAGQLTIEGLDRELSRAIKRVNEVMKGAAAESGAVRYANRRLATART